MGASVRPESLAERAERLSQERQRVSMPETLAQRAQRLSIAKPEELDRDTTAGGAINPDEESPGYGGRFVRTVLSAASGIPGVEAAMAGAGVVGSRFTDNPLSYDESLNTLREEIDRMGTGRKVASKIVGATAALPFLPANPVAGGAAFGAADQLLDADPDEGIGERVLEGVGGAAVGGAVGKFGELAGAGVRALAATPFGQRAKNLAAEGKKLVEPLYDRAIKEGGAGRTSVAPEIAKVLAKPDIAAKVKELQSLREFAGMSADDPRMLDAVYKSLVDESRQLSRRLDAVTPNKPNVGRFAKRDVDLAKQELLDAMSGGASMPGPMPSYRPAVKEAAKQKSLEEALNRGNDALRSTLNRNLPMGKTQVKNSPEAFEEFLRGASPEARAMSVEGILAGGKRQVSKNNPLRPIRGRKGRDAIQEMPSLLRLAGDPRQARLDDLVKAGVIPTSQGYGSLVDLFDQ